MSEVTRVKCLSCSREILAVTAVRTDGYCKPCKRDRGLSESELFQREIFDKIDAVVEPFSDYPNALSRLKQHPVGFQYCFAFHHANAEILNGGISQLYRNSTWCLVPDAINAAEKAGFTQLYHLFVQIVFYYHRRNRSRLKLRIDETIFDSIDTAWDKSLKQLDDEYFKLTSESSDVVSELCSNHRHLFRP